MVALIVKKEQRTAQYFKEQLGNDVALPMILVNGGKFMMGSPETEEDRSSDEGPQHSVTVKNFFLGRYPVTQEQWQIVAETYDKVNLELNPKPSNFEGAKRPVEQVSWYQAQEYCDRLAQKTKRPYRLPTEAEWEYACRAGTETPFYFGNTISTELVNYDGSIPLAGRIVTQSQRRRETISVDHFKIANAWGLSDMHGNVLEWCQDHWHDNYRDAPKDGSAWLTDNPDASRVWRGGSWDTYPRNCRSAYRCVNYPADRIYNLGFRVSCSAPATL
jgi:formylglycine-generating enzyme required for sulfatase activity